MKEIVEAFNALAFITPRTLSSIVTLEELSQEVQNDYLEAFNYFLTHCGKSKNHLKDLANGFSNDIDFFTVTELFPHELLIKSYMGVMNECEGSGIGFTPLLSTHDNELIHGFNCLAKTIVLGALIKKLGHMIKLALMVDHAAVLIVRPEGNYYCRIDQQSFILLQGTYQQHDLYQWYTVHPSDDLLFHYIAVQDFNNGILNGICENFAFLKVINDIEIGVHEKRMKAILQEKYPFKELLDTIEWTQLQLSMFGKMDAYRQEHEIEFLIECENVNEQRTIINRCVKQLDDAVATAFEVCTGETLEGNNLYDFLYGWGSDLKDSFKSLANGLSLNLPEFEIIIPKGLIPFIQELHTQLKADKILRKYFILHTLGAVDRVE
ncbi:MAG: hypothetical protein ABIO57_04070 [Candidatus Paceibacterota bacterium]